MNREVVIFSLITLKTAFTLDEFRELLWLGFAFYCKHILKHSM